ncbi:MAG: 3-hydroxyacyl-ACP dehydratase FabZ [Alphaproteobacteria bacterium]|jgi:3-hydroxyacyl-[acyl-carrier-protein] dehydratase|nr:3-hydroxyacyl-ACP dehydratase FabZ [Alphaproteobacteria bacterium]MBT5827394.1 3-hydroxyacyl-ACP dehydratase FabZ [Alphaproteobacteria bacterium]
MTKEILLEEILTLIPHRYPLLLVDRVVDYTENKSATGVKNVTFNEPHFTGHFPDKPIMPGVLIVEALAQTSAIMVSKSNSDKGDKLVYFMSIDNVKFRKPVVPGDQLILKVETIQNRGQVWKFKGEAFVNEKIVAEASFAAMIVDKKDGK